MKKMKLSIAVIALAGIFTFTSCEKEENSFTGYTGSSPDPVMMSIADFVIASPDYSILRDALVKTEMADIFRTEGSYTVFAPNNEAFENLFIQLGINDLSVLSAEALTPILLYHVLGEKKTSGMLDGGYYNTLSSAYGYNVGMIINTEGAVSINNKANVISADNLFSNGVVHAIDNVLLPPTVVDKALASENFSILVQAVLKAGLAETLKGAGPFTIFAPTNDAFVKLFAEIGVSGVADLTAEQLTPILLYHVVPGNVRSYTLTDGSVETLAGTIDISVSPSPAINSYSDIIAADLQAVNGVIHVIDEVLLPSKRK